MGILRSDRVSGLGGANAINGSVFFGGGEQVSGGSASNNILITEVSSDFTFGTGDFTIEGWFYTPDLSNWNLLVGDNVYQSTGGWSLYFNTDPDVDWWKGVSSVVSGATPTANTWHHVAFSRESGTNRVFLDGALGASASDSTDYTATQILIGANQLVASTNVSQWGFKGYASNVRVIKGEAIYTAAFTAPTTRLEKTDNTVLLCCQSPGNILQEATGKTLYTLNTPVASNFAPDLGEDHGTTFTDNTKFDTLSYMVPPGGTTAQSNRGRGVYGGGIQAPSSATAEIQYVQIQSQGNAVDFGSLTVARTAVGGSGNSTRGIFSGGAPNNTEIDYVTISTTAKAVDFGDMTVGRGVGNGCVSSSTRGIVGWGGYTGSNSDVIDYVTIASAGNATDFGDTVGTASRNNGTASSPTRGVRGGGYTSGAINVIDYITIATTGDSQDFGDLTEARFSCGGASSNTRCIWGGGGPSAKNTMDYVTIATLGNATDFGDLSQGRIGTSPLSNSIRGVWAGGYTPTFVNTMDYAVIATTGNASDFGDAVNKHRNMGATTDSHGGLS